ncbi:L-aminoadipate-semialdehyde dehydrogenase-phosphopantetheinyl transferase [Denticeps clupeoides]|uniref:L-aminoadipate-semialdehyde dehydrogenase-phosphopantetheinyl transferase n=1 Tax=Denticeps clupeoides TaxID=299321 RepID=A0AAY4CTV2_9TELE|nr:L-aminoadipate-semialdehyde dehydrogenase-phosphopantetheinyl transferase [Denticeps clupeoides]
MGGVRWAFRCGSWSPTRSEWLRAARCVQREEKERIRQFVFAKDAKSAMAGRLLIRKLVSEKVGIAWDQIHLDRTAKGKPFLANPATHAANRKWNFNVSHQGDFAVLAAEQGLEVGVDVMKTTRPGSSSIPDFFRIMTRQFTVHEWTTIRAAGSDLDQLDMFYRHWALKESFIKAIGTGLGFNLQRAEFHVAPLAMVEGQLYRQSRLHLDEEEEDDWVFEECLLDKHHHIAVALGRSETPGPERPPWSFCDSAPSEFTVLSFSDLISGAMPLTEEDPAYWDIFKVKQDAPTRQSDTN